VSQNFGATIGEAVDTAIKSAETDATKRALVTFGYCFGLALYDKDKAHVKAPGDEPTAPRAAQIEPPKPHPINVGFSRQSTSNGPRRLSMGAQS
jgi:Rad52/22 family double-strand break repair protein